MRHLTVNARRVVLLPVLMQLVLVAACVESPSLESETKLKKVQIGMTRSEVQGLIGDPVETDSFDSTKHGTEVEVWYYPQSYAASEAPRCVFSRESGQVVEVVGSDSYRIP